MQPSTPASLSVFAYTDYRAFLRDAYAERRDRDPRFSHRFISAKVGAGSSGWFADVLKGRSNLAGAQMVKLALLLMLKDNETDYFETLVQYDQAGSMEERNRIFKRLSSFRDVRVDLVGQDKFEYYGKWYHAAVREALFFAPFKGDYASLGKMLVPPIKPAQARESIQLLLNLGFIKKDAQGRMRPTSATLKKDASFHSLFTSNYLKANMELAMGALDLFPKDERHISAMTVSYSLPGFRKAVAEIESLRKRLVLLMEEDAHPDKAYQLNLQLFPVTA